MGKKQKPPKETPVLPPTEVKKKRLAGEPVAHPRHTGAYLHKGIAVGKGSALHAALEDRDADLIDALYEAGKQDFIDTYGKEFWDYSYP